VGGLLLCLLPLAFVLPAVLRTWAVLSPHGSPMGPDADLNELASVVFLEGGAERYPFERFPGYPALVALLAGTPRAVAATGMSVSMAAWAVAVAAAGVVAWQLGGRLAGAATVLGVACLPGGVDAGRQLTPYASVAALDLVAVASLSAVSRARGWPAWVLAACVGGLVTLDAKQLPVALGFVGLGVLRLLATRGVRGTLPAAALVGLPVVANAWMGALPVRLLGPEAILTRAELGLVMDASVRAADGWVPGGGPTALARTLLRLARDVHPPAGQAWFHPRAVSGLGMEFAGVSALPVLVWPLLAWRQIRGSGRGWPLVAALPLAPVAVASLHLFFQHRYVLPVVMLAVAWTLAGLRRALGRAAMSAFVLVAFAMPGSPWRTLAPGILAPPPPHAEPWAGVEAPDVAGARRAMDASLPPDAFVLDFAQARPWAFLAPVRRYARCTPTRDTCASWLDAPGTLHAVFVPREAVSAGVEGASGIADAATPPARLGACWVRVAARPDTGGLYAWRCPTRPTRTRTDVTPLAGGVAGGSEPPAP
jgi:hypothetical protein